MAKQGTKVTVADIAKKAGVSVATVSNAMNGTGRMAEATREKVRKAMDELGFVRDYSAAKLRTGRSRLVGVLIQDVANPFYGEFSATFEAVLTRRGFLPILANIGEDRERQASMIAEVLAHGVAGMVISPCASSIAKDLAPIINQRIPCVTFVREVDGLPFDFVGADDYEGAALAARQFLADGHRNFAVIGGLEETTTGHLRVKGFVETLKSEGIAEENIHVVQGPQSRAFGRQGAEELLKSGAAFTAVFCHNDLVAMGASAGFIENGRHIGKDLSLIGFDNLPEAELWSPPLTSVEIGPRSIGDQVAEWLVERMEGQSGPARATRLRPRLVVRKSTVTA
ncbi:LacI family transcriptional regulator [Rhodobacteraceae bacterium RKSG542]|uniref:LacI family DNA-binding transcriptional regulator n=1 Tax=Pseudovibrio flavus TaxID=2529854 RepID=UPI0012BD49B2|nr:LacI family DNA-binding transcriptional regulator [Pseudovibrio flavus]MTI15982.1 LacI family transcriptional regulator [Pseudovibrio flavus]